MRFQSTPPSRVATPGRAAKRRRETFQSTPPSRVATSASIYVTIGDGFQSTPPSRVATPVWVALTLGMIISIHTTLAGGDLHGRQSVGVRLFDFNPHHPRGWRLNSCISGKTEGHFNPHHPRGWRHSIFRIILLREVFQSTPPSRVATHVCVSGGTLTTISIHTTLAGGDRHPYPPLCLIYISIHTTLAGGDWSPHPPFPQSLISIHTTLAGGDQQFIVLYTVPNDFNPHHPRGWRLFCWCCRKNHII